VKRFFDEGSDDPHHPAMWTAAAEGRRLVDSSRVQQPHALATSSGGLALEELFRFIHHATV
jgi:hypothetical protein